MPTLSPENPYRALTPAGTETGPWGTNFSAGEAGEVAVIVLTADGLPQELTAGISKTVASGNALEGFVWNVGLSGLPNGWANWPAGVRLFLVRRSVLSQPYGLSPTLGVQPASMRNRLDALTRQSQEHRMEAVRAISAPYGEAGPDLPGQERRAGKLAVFDDDGNFDTSRDLVAFDQDVSNTAVKAGEAAASAQSADNSASLAETYRNQTAEALEAGQLLFDNISVAQLEAINAIILRTEEVAENLTLREISSLGAIDDAKTEAQAAIADDKQAAADSAAAAATTAEEVQTFYETAIQPLPDRVAVLENAALTVSLSASTTQAENGSSVAVTLTRTLSQAVTTATIDQGVGAVATTAGTVGGIATGANVTANRTWTLTVTTPGGARTATASIAFLNRMFWGAYATNDLHTKTAAEIRAALVATSALATNANRSMTITPAGTQFIYVAIPAGFSLSRLTAYGFDELENCVSNAVVIDDAGGTDRNYTLYRLPFALTGAVEVQTYA